jgi:integrase
LVGEKAVPTWNFKVEKDRAKREDIGIEDAHNLLTRAFNWSLQQTTPTQGYYRSLMFHVLAVMNCSGMRTGEVLHLKRADVGKLYDRLLCDVKVKATNSKSQKTRTITVGGLLSGPSEAFGKHNYLHEWLTKHSLKDAEYVFSDKEGGYVENVFFKTYGQFREYLQQFNLQHLTAYHMRHAFINDRLRAGVSPMVLAAHCGTSIRMISQTYAHISGIEASREIAAKPYVYK